MSHPLAGGLTSSLPLHWLHLCKPSPYSSQCSPLTPSSPAKTTRWGESCPLVCLANFASQAQVDREWWWEQVRADRPTDWLRGMPLSAPKALCSGEPLPGHGEPGFTRGGRGWGASTEPPRRAERHHACCVYGCPWTPAFPSGWDGCPLTGDVDRHDSGSQGGIWHGCLSV